MFDLFKKSSKGVKVIDKVRAQESIAEMTGTDYLAQSPKEWFILNLKGK